MTLTLEEVARIAKLARLALGPGEAEETLAKLNGIFGLIEQLNAVDTTGVEPLAHPLAAIQDVALRLREDEATETDRREANMANAPEMQDGLFLVPKVIE
jgi:aspartyl-tRNA(Asn)/glutamyl-tRNA(Gln) amidotransferase subunit C